jgi:hypothetical protein
MIPRRRLALLALLLGARVIAAQPNGLAVTVTFLLTTPKDGLNGYLQLLEDERLTPDLHQKLWASGGPGMALDHNDPLYKRLTMPPLRRAILRLLDERGRVMGQLTLQRELALLQGASLHTGYRTLLVTTDLTHGYGSYSGPITQILDLSQGKLEIAIARNAITGNPVPIYLARTLKTEWRVSADTPRPGAPIDLLEVACRPSANAPLDPSLGDFAIIRTRYHWTGTEWIYARRRAPGFWEADQPFPPMENFPRAILLPQLPTTASATTAATAATASSQSVSAKK